MKHKANTPIMSLLRQMSPVEREQWAALAGTRVNYLYHIGSGAREPKVRLAVSIADATQTMHVMNPALPVLTVRDIAG